MNKFISLILISICFVVSGCESKSSPSASFIEGTYERNSLNNLSSYTFSSDGLVIEKRNAHTFPAIRYSIEKNIIKGKDGNVLDFVIQDDGSIGNSAAGRYVKK